MSPRVLIADDVLANSLKQAIQLDYPRATVGTASSAAGALVLMRSLQPEVAFIELELLTDRVEEFPKEARLRSAVGYIPLIAVTARRLKWSDKLGLYKAGFNDILLKPFEIESFLNKIVEFSFVHENNPKALVYLGIERENHDYKETVDLVTKDGRASLSKDVIAMANWGGGNIVVGVAERSPGKFTPVGVPKKVVESFEVSRFNRALRDFLDPPIAVVPRILRDKSRVYIVLRVPAAAGTLVFAKKENERAHLFRGRIYSRTSAAESAEVQSAAELRELLQRVWAV
jgi:CheY-like chemotaxis protein